MASDPTRRLSLILVAAMCMQSCASAAPPSCAIAFNQNVERVSQYGESVLIAEVAPLGSPVEEGQRAGGFFSGRISTIFSVTPIHFYRNTIPVPKNGFRAVDVARFAADGGPLSDSSLAPWPSRSLIGVKRVNSKLADYEIGSAIDCNAKID